MQFSASGTLLVLLSTIVVMLIGIGIALYFKKKTVTAEDWALGGRRMPWYVIVFTQFATLVGGGVLVGHVGIGYSFGYAPIAYGICGAAGCFFMAFIAGWLRENEFTTVPDILEKVYGKNALLALVGAVMAIVVPFGWIASQAIAFAKLYSTITGIGINTLVIAVLVICVLFTIPSGFSAIAWSDFIFGLIMVAMCFVTGKIALDIGGGWSHILSVHPSPEMLSFPGGILSAGITTTALWFIAATPGMMTNQMTFQRVCAADTAKNASRTLVIGGILIAAIEAWVVIVGNAVRVAQPSIRPEMASGWFLAQLPPVILAMFSGFIATTIISTTDSALQSVAVNLTRDIYGRFINPGADDRKLLSVSKTCTVLVAAASALLAISFPQVLNLLVITYSYSASALLVPIYCGYALRRTDMLTPAAGVCSMLGGIAGCYLARANAAALPAVFGIKLPYAIYGIAASLVCLILVGAVTKRSK